MTIEKDFFVLPVIKMLEENLIQNWQPRLTSAGDLPIAHSSKYEFDFI